MACTVPGSNAGGCGGFPDIVLCEVERGSDWSEGPVDGCVLETDAVAVTGLKGPVAGFVGVFPADGGRCRSPSRGKVAASNCLRDARKADRSIAQLGGQEIGSDRDRARRSLLEASEAFGKGLG